MTTQTITREALEAFVAQQTTHFSWEDMGDNLFQWESRDYGDIGEEEPGEEDVREARRLLKLLRTQFPNIQATFETVDEWVQVEIRL